MTDNKRMIARYMDGFNKSDHDQILSCLTDDVVWVMPGAARSRAGMPILHWTSGRSGPKL